MLKQIQSDFIFWGPNPAFDLLNRVWCVCESMFSSHLELTTVGLGLLDLVEEQSVVTKSVQTATSPFPL